MYALFLLILLQTQKAPDVATPRGPSIPFEKSVPRPDAQHLPLTPTVRTTPNLLINSDLMTHYEIGIDVGSQREALGELKGKISSLEDKRNKDDRPDIDSLKTSREHAY